MFASYHELARKADELVCKLSDRAELMVKPSCFDWIEGFTDNQANANVKWISEVSLADCIYKTTNISAYCEFGLSRTTQTG